MNQNKVIGIIGIAGSAALLLATVISIVTFEEGVFSPLNCFFNELGLYTNGYFTMSSALVFNIGFILFGASLCVLMVFWGIRQATWGFGIVAFSGILTGVLAAALALFTLNFAKYHYVVAAAFFAAIFLFCAAYIVVSILSGRQKIGLLLIAFFSAICAALSAIFVISGGMAQLFIEDASMVGRLSFLPFALLGWISLLLFMALLVTLCANQFKNEPSTLSYLDQKTRRDSVRDFDF